MTSKFSQSGELASGEIKKYKYVSHVNSRWNSNASTSYKLVLRVCSSEGNRLQSDDSNEPKRMESNCYTIIILAGNREQTKDTNKMEAELWIYLKQTEDNPFIKPNRFLRRLSALSRQATASKQSKTTWKALARDFTKPQKRPNLYEHSGTGS